MYDAIEEYQGEFEEYELLRVLNRNEVGVVFLARHEEFDVQVTLKLLRDPQDEEGRKRITRAARVLYSFVHPNIVAARDFGRTPGGYLYFTMNYVPGRDLASILEDKGPMDPMQACAILRQALAALDYSHKKGVLHRNLHLGSVVVSNEDYTPHATLLGFGIAKVTEDPLKQDDLTQISNINPMGGLKGTEIGQPQYMAPELALHTATAQTDIFSLSVVFVEMLTGAIDWRDYLLDGIWASKSPQFFMNRVRNQCELPKELEQLLEQGLAYSASSRIPTANEFLKRLERYLIRKVDRESLARWFGSIDKSKRLPDIGEITSRERDKAKQLIQRITEEEKQRVEEEIDKIRAQSSENIARALEEEKGRMQRVRARLGESGEYPPAMAMPDLTAVKENAIVRCGGVMSLQTTAKLRAMLLDLRQRGHLRIILDLKKINIMTVDALPVLLNVAKLFGGCHCFALANIPKSMAIIKDMPKILMRCRIIEDEINSALFENQMGIYEWLG